MKQILIHICLDVDDTQYHGFALDKNSERIDKLTPWISRSLLKTTFTLPLPFAKMQRHASWNSDSVSADTKSLETGATTYSQVNLTTMMKSVLDRFQTGAIVHDSEYGELDSDTEKIFSSYSKFNINTPFPYRVE